LCPLITLGNLGLRKENLYLCKDFKEHAKIHSSFEALATELIKKGIVGFKNGKYFLI